MSSVTAGQIRYDDPIENALAGIGSALKGDYRISRRAMALLLLQGDAQVEQEVKAQDGPGYASVQQLIEHTREAYNRPLSYVIALRHQQETRRILASVVSSKQKTAGTFAERLSRAMMNPWTGAPILLVVLYVGLYLFVGVFGAGTMVGLIEKTLFGQWINPWVTVFAARVIPWKILQELFVGQYGIITLGLTYAFALILPIVTTFFIAFSIIEDSGYLPRLAMLIDRLFKIIGLSGRAVIPMVLGFGCDTMATIVTRTQETKRERVITTLLLALAIPCSAQLGVILAILSGNPGALLTWALVVGAVLLIIGFLASRVIPGHRASFYIEVPPLRLPKLSNVLLKTLTRLQWYFIEVLPVFIIASVLLWAGKLTGVLDFLSNALQPVVTFIGLPAQTSVVFLYGFFRRDFGAAGLYNLHSAGVLTGVPLVVSAVVLTLFVPCIAQFSVMLKERGVRTALAIAGFIFPFAFLVGWLLNMLLRALRVSL